MMSYTFLHYPIDTVVFAHGAPPSPELAAQVLPAARRVLVTDGALTNYLDLTDRLPEVVIGDGDSVSPELLREHGLTFTRIDEQMTNDLTKAVTHALAKGWGPITIIGATGLREDHAISNAFLLLDYLDAGAKVQMVTDYGTFLPFAGRLELDLPIGQEISLFAQDHKPMSAAGVAFPFERKTFTRMWQMTLNIVTESPVRLETEGEALLYVAREQAVPRDKIKI
jgi:thiamine pyrophosphokinase